MRFYFPYSKTITSSTRASLKSLIDYVKLLVPFFIRGRSRRGAIVIVRSAILGRGEDNNKRFIQTHIPPNHCIQGLLKKQRNSEAEFTSSQLPHPEPIHSLISAIICVYRQPSTEAATCNSKGNLNALYSSSYCGLCLMGAIDDEIYTINTL